MAVKQDPRTGIWYDWTLGDNNYDVNLNANLKKIGLLYALSAKSRTVSTPPGSPANGDVYIVGPSATGVWATHEDDVTIWISAETAWVFYTPRTGFLCDVEDEDLLCKHSGSAWVSVGDSWVGTSADNRLARYNGTNAVQGSGITVDDSDNITGVTALTLSSDLNNATADLNVNVSTSNKCLRAQKAADTDFDTDETLNTGITNNFGLMIVKETVDGVTGMFRIEGTSIVDIGSNAAFTTTKDNAGTYNVYFDTDAFYVQNKVGDNKAVAVSFYGA